MFLVVRVSLPLRRSIQLYCGTAYIRGAPVLLRTAWRRRRRFDADGLSRVFSGDVWVLCDVVCVLRRSYTSNIFVSKRQQAAASRRATVEQLQSNQGNGPVCCGNAAACCPRADPGQSSCCSAFGRLGSLSCMTSTSISANQREAAACCRKVRFF